MPGDPIDVMVQSDPNLTTSDAERLKALYGLDKPLLERYKNWLSSALTGDFGYSRIHNRPTLEILVPRLINTTWLMAASLFLSLILAIPSGIYSALHPYSRSDYFINFSARRDFDSSILVGVDADNSFFGFSRLASGRGHGGYRCRWVSSPNFTHDFARSHIEHRFYWKPNAICALRNDGSTPQ